MRACACNPGTFENGWMEERCDACLRVEMAAWDGLIERAREFAARTRGGAS